MGARTSFHRASLALEVGRDGPRASLVLTLGRWLRVDSVLPVEARFAISLDGVAIGPRLNGSAD